MNMISTQIQCLECSKFFKQITNKHLATHALTPAAYKEKHNGAKLVSEEVSAKASSHVKKLNSVRDYSAIGQKISNTKKLNPKESHNKGKSTSEETKLKLKTTIYEKKLAGTYIPTRAGAVLTEEVKKKISDSIKKSDRYLSFIDHRLEKQKQYKEAQIKKLESYKIKITKQLDSKNLSLVKVEDNKAIFSCKICNSIFHRTEQYLDNSRIHLVSCRECNPSQRTSIDENLLFDYIKSICSDAIQGDRTVLGGKELDIWIPSKNIAFEYNGLYWHSELVRGDPMHLRWKQQYAAKLGIKVFNIFEDEWKDKQSIVKSRIDHILGVSSKTVFARKCEIKEISNKDKNEFLENYHIQGSDVSKIRYGLFHNDELIAVMTFKKSSFVKGGDGSKIELNRFAVKSGYSIPGGASKLLSKFIKDHSPKTIISFADQRWSSGHLYKSLGFKFKSASRPSYWYMLKYQERLHRSNFMKHMLVENGADSNLSEWEIMQSRGYDRIWDCGTVSYELITDDNCN